MENIIKLFKRRISHITLYLLIAIPVSLYLVLTIPPGFNHDEMEHYFRVVSISDGHILAEEAPINTLVNGRGDNSNIKNANVGGRINMDVYNLVVNNFKKSWNGDRKYNFPYAFADNNLYSSDDAKMDTPIAFTNTSVYSPVAYAPYIIGYKVATIFTHDAKIDFIITKIIALLLFLLFISFIIHLAPPLYRSFFAIFALIPNVIVSITSITSDSMNICSIALYIVMSINAIIGIKNIKPLDLKHLAIFALSIIMLSFIKITLFPCILLLILLPITNYYHHHKLADNLDSEQMLDELNFHEKIMREKIVVIVSATISFISFTVWYFLAGGGDIRGYYFSESGGVAGKLSEILADIPRFISILIDSIIHDSSDAFSKIFIDNQYQYSQVIFIYAVILIFVIYFTLKSIIDSNKSAINSNNEQNMLNAKSTKVTRLILIAFLVLQLLGTYTVLFLSFTPSGVDSIWGVQGRYFLPLIPLLLFYVAYPQLIEGNLNIFYDQKRKTVKFFDKNKSYILYIIIAVILIIFCQMSFHAIYQ